MEEDTMERTRPIHSRTRRSEEHTSALHGALPIYKSTAPSMLRGVSSIRRPWGSSNSDRIREDRKYCGGCHPDDPSRTGRLSCQHHATRHKWRRILWSELGLSIPEPEPCIRHIPDLLDATDPHFPLFRIRPTDRQETGKSSHTLGCLRPLCAGSLDRVHP